MNTVIYGARSIALGTWQAYTCLYPDRLVEAFIVTDMADNPHMLAGLPVWTLEEFSGKLTQEEKDRTEVVIATPEPVFEEIIQGLLQQHFRHYTTIDSVQYADMRKQYHLGQRDVTLLSELRKGEKTSTLQVLLVCSDRDKPLRNPYEYPDYMKRIYVGTKTDKYDNCLYDHTGVNIFHKNRNYCELTALYWLWQNRLETEEMTAVEYYGLMQYRRILMLEKDDLMRLAENGVEVILPYPMPYEPDIEVHHQRYIKQQDWQVLLGALEEKSPEYADDFQEVLRGRYLYNYNIVIAKGEVLRDYCRWLFPILEWVEEHSVPRGAERADRYIGYMAETLETLYFMKNKERWRVVHTGCRLLT